MGMINKNRCSYDSHSYDSSGEAILAIIFNELGYEFDPHPKGNLQHPDFILHGFRDNFRGVRVEVKGGLFGRSEIISANQQKLYIKHLLSSEEYFLYIVAMPQRHYIKTPLDVARLFLEHYDKSDMIERSHLGGYEITCFDDPYLDRCFFLRNLIVEKNLHKKSNEDKFNKIIQNIYLSIITDIK